MPNPLTFAHTVPNEIRDWAKEQTAYARSNKNRLEISSSINRLVAYNTNKSVWIPLNKLASEHLTLNLMGVVQAASSAPSEFDRLSKDPLHLVKQDADAVARTAQGMARDLRQLMKRVSFQNQHTLSLYSIAMTAAKDSDQPLPQILADDSDLQEKLLDIERYTPDIPALVSAMSDTLKKVIADEYKLRPRKMTAASAKRTFVVVTLKRYFRKAMGRVPASLVAKIVNLTLDQTDTTADTVRKAPG